MTTPSQDLVRQFDESRQKDQLFASQRDYDSQVRILRKQIQEEGTAVVLLPRTSHRRPQGTMQASGVDPLDGDVLDLHFNAEESHRLALWVPHAPSKQMLKKYGIDEDRDVVFWFLFEDLKDAGLVTQQKFRGIDLGDLVVWDRTWYRIDNVHRHEYLGQSERFFYSLGFSTRYRKGL